jgi:hypothetical protein
MMPPKPHEWPILFASLYVLLSVASWQLALAGVAEFSPGDLVVIDSLFCALTIGWFHRKSLPGLRKR